MPLRSPTRRATSFWTTFLGVFLLDVASKRMAVAYFSPAHVPHDIVGDFLRFTLAYNQGGAMSLSLGPSSRWWFTVLALGTLIVLGWLYRQTPPHDRVQLTALALVCGGAVGNLVDRVRWGRGVVDFIDIGLGSHRFFTFNVADVGVTLGTVLLTWSLTRRAARDGEAAKAGTNPLHRGEAL